MTEPNRRERELAHQHKGKMPTEYKLAAYRAELIAPFEALRRAAESFGDVWAAKQLETLCRKAREGET